MDYGWGFALPKLINAEAWEDWKNMLLSNEPDMREYGKQVGLYMHCMLQ